MNEWERKSRYVKIGDKVFPRTIYTNFIMEKGLEEKLLESGLTSPKTFVRERHMDLWTAYQVIKRIEHSIILGV